LESDVGETEPHDMQGSDQERRSGKAVKGADREARLAVKLRQNLVRRKEKARAAAKSADGAAAASSVSAVSTLPGDNDKGD
jgi:hypothetical protein